MRFCPQRWEPDRVASPRRKYLYRTDPRREMLSSSWLSRWYHTPSIEENFLFPAAPEDYPTPERLTIAETPAPDLEALRKEAEAEIAAWEAENGPLPIAGFSLGVLVAVPQGFDHRFDVVSGVVFLSGNGEGQEL